MNETLASPPERLPELNLPLLRKTMDWLKVQAAKPIEDSEWNQKMWRIVDGRSCGTIYCVAGYVAQITGAEFTGQSGGGWLVANDDDDPHDVEIIEVEGESVAAIETSTRATRLLGLADWETVSMFDGSSSYDHIRRVVDEACKRRGQEL